MANKKTDKLYYSYPSRASFVEQDVQALSEDYVINHLVLNWRSKVLLPLNLIRQFGHLCCRMCGTRAVIVSFAGYHSFLPVLFARLKGIPSFVILNGTDSVGISELNYGSHLKKIQRLFCKWTLSMATEMWPVSPSLMKGQNSFIGRRLEYGVQITWPSLKTPYTVIANGFYPDQWTCTNDRTFRSGAITVVSSESQFKLKGVDLIIEVAHKLTELEFTIVGMQQPEGNFPDNIKFVGRVDQKRLQELYAQNRFYLQLSSFEGFGCSLCEAMLAGCIAIGSDVNAIPAIVGNPELILKRKDTDDLVKLIIKLENEPEQTKAERSEKGSDHISSTFSMEKRRNAMNTRLAFYWSKLHSK